MQFITDPVFYAIAVPAVLIVGFSKAGVGGGLVFGFMNDDVIRIVVGGDVVLPDAQQGPAQQDHLAGRGLSDVRDDRPDRG